MRGLNNTLSVSLQPISKALLLTRIFVNKNEKVSSRNRGKFGETSKPATLAKPPTRTDVFQSDGWTVRAHYHCERNHQGIGNQLNDCPDAVVLRCAGRVKRRQRLGGMLSFYYREAV